MTKVVLEKLDPKFSGVIFKVKDWTIVTDDQYVAFLAKDDAFAEMILTYRQECVDLGCDQEQVAAVDRMIERLRRWRAANEHRLKAPDAVGELLLG